MEIDKFRFGVCRGDDALSPTWLATSRKSDFYVGISSQMGHCKVSLHQSGRVRMALAESYLPRLVNEVKADPDRALSKWTRPATPDRGATQVLSIIFPTDGLRAKYKLTRGKPGKPVFWFEAAPVGQAIEFGFFYSKEAPASLEEKLEKVGHPLVSTPLSSGEFVHTVARVIPFNIEVLPAFTDGALRSLSDDLNELKPGDSISAGGFFVNDPDIDGALKIVQATGLRITRNKS